MNGHSVADERLRDLITACKDTLSACQFSTVNVAAAVLSGDNRIFTGVQVRSRNCNHCSTCAEAIAIGAALTAGATAFDACVALRRRADDFTLWSPCGTCRELLHDLGFGRVVIADTGPGITTVTATELLPWP